MKKVMPFRTDIPSHSVELIGNHLILRRKTLPNR